MKKKVTHNRKADQILKDNDPQLERQFLFWAPVEEFGKLNQEQIIMLSGNIDVLYSQNQKQDHRSKKMSSSLLFCESMRLKGVEDLKRKISILGDLFSLRRSLKTSIIALFWIFSTVIAWIFLTLIKQIGLEKDINMMSFQYSLQGILTSLILLISCGVLQYFCKKPYQLIKKVLFDQQENQQWSKAQVKKKIQYLKNNSLNWFQQLALFQLNQININYKAWYQNNTVTNEGRPIIQIKQIIRINIRKQNQKNALKRQKQLEIKNKVFVEIQYFSLYVLSWISGFLTFFYFTLKQMKAIQKRVWDYRTYLLTIAICILVIFNYFIWFGIEIPRTSRLFKIWQKLPNSLIKAQKEELKQWIEDN